MVLIAFSLQDQVEKYGAYVGIAAFFGLAILSLLYFAQAREVKRLREWAGRAPERAAELEVAVAEHAQEVRRVPVTPVPQPQPVAQPLSPSVAATNGAVKLKPEEVAALAFARSAGIHEPHEPKAHPVPVATAPATEIATAEPAAAQALNGGGNGSRSVPAPATPAARRAGAVAGRRPVAPPPPRREGSSIVSVVVVAIIGVVVLGGVGFFLFGRGGDDPKPAAHTGPKIVNSPTPEPEASKTPKPTPAPTKQTALIAVYNGTTSEGLAAQQSELLEQDGYPKSNLGTDTAPPEQQRTTSVVMYRRGAKSAAAGVADVLGITAIQQLDDATQTLIANAPKKWNVVVIVGSDKTN